MALLAAVGKNLHVLWTRGPQFEERPSSNGTMQLVLKRVCGRPTPEYRNFEFYVRPWIAFVFISALPFCIIVFCNVFIVRALIRYMTDVFVCSLLCVIYLMIHIISNK